MNASTRAPLTSPFSDGRLAAEVDFALRALHASLDLMRRTGRPPLEERSQKPDHSPVTAVDFAVQALLLGLLDRAFPQDAFVAEEDGAELPRRQAWLDFAVGAVRSVLPDAGAGDVGRWFERRPRLGGRLWAIDPVDGTKGLLRGGQYVSALALIEDGRVVLGGLACPCFDRFGEGGCLALAMRGGGAWALARPASPWQRLAVAAEIAPEGGRLIRSVESSPRSDLRLAALRRELGLSGDEIRLDSQVKYLALAAGEGQLVVRLPRRSGRQAENTWDHAAGTLLAAEAGARVSDVRGAPLDFGQGARLERNLGVVAAVPALHDRTVQALRQVLDEIP